MKVLQERVSSFLFYAEKTHAYKQVRGLLDLALARVLELDDDDDEEEEDMDSEDYADIIQSSLTGDDGAIDYDPEWDMLGKKALGRIAQMQQAENIARSSGWLDDSKDLPKWEHETCRGVGHAWQYDPFSSVVLVDYSGW